MFSLKSSFELEMVAGMPSFCKTSRDTAAPPRLLLRLK